MTAADRKAILVRLRANHEPMTAGELGFTSKQLRRVEGVKVVGTRRTGEKGRPALLFMVAR